MYRCSVAQCGAVQCGAVQRSAAQYGAVWCSALQHAHSPHIGLRGVPAPYCGVFSMVLSIVC